ncbi:MAG: cysteine desulfurase family protein, partial [Verrucomicrobiota bacterium]
MVYLDYNATTPLAPEALDAMLPFLRGSFGNPSSIHAAGREARAAIDDARDALAALLGVKPHEIIFTGGGTEACNLAVLGLAHAHAPRGRHLITAAAEHHAVLHAFEHLQHHEGFELTILPVDAGGRVNPDDLRAALRVDTGLVSVMHANNETGTIQPIEELSAICREGGICFHTDAVQTFGKLPVRPLDLGASAVSLAAHKFGGPKGVGALYLRAGVAISRTAHGGSHENTRRPGTENVAAIAGMAAAAAGSEAKRAAEQPRLAVLRDRLWLGIH